LVSPKTLSDFIHLLFPEKQFCSLGERSEQIFFLGCRYKMDTYRNNKQINGYRYKMNTWRNNNQIKEK